MLRALQTAALGMQAQQTNVDNIANNLANANTTGFKQSRVVFQDLVYENLPSVNEGDGQLNEGEPSQLQIGNGSAAVATVRKFTPGSFRETGNPLDVAIQGDGFLQVQRPDRSVAYTRDGTLTVNSEGQVITQSGLPLEPPLSIPSDASEVSISSDGRVMAKLQGDNAPVEVGQIELARFVNPAGLESAGGNLYESTSASGEAILGLPGRQGLGTIRQGYLESSNVDVVKEMVNLIRAQRAYEINSKMVTTAEEMLQTTNNIKR